MIEQLFEFFSGAGKHWALFFVSVFPFIELRGAIPFGILALDMPWYQAFLLSFAANLLPIPVVYFLTRPLFAALRKTKLFSGFIDRFEAKMMKKSEKVNDIEKIYDTVNNEIADDKLDCVAGGSGADNKYAAVKTGD